MVRGLLALGIVIALAAPARADRVPSSKANRTYNSGANPDITVPYLTNTRSTLGVAQGVAPIIIASPGLGDAKGDTQRPVFNLIFYGSWKSASPDFIHATSRPPNNLRPNK